MISSGYIKLYRTIKDQPWYQDSEAVHLYIHLLLKATHEERQAIFGGKVIQLQPGQFITGRNKLSFETGINRNKVERCLKLFEQCGQIEQQTSNVNRCISMLNWDKWQKSEQQMSSERAAEITLFEKNSKKNSKKRAANEQQTSSLNYCKADNYEHLQQTNEQQTSNKRATNEQQTSSERAHNKNEKNDKNEKEEKNKTTPAHEAEPFAGWIEQLKTDDLFREQVARQHALFASEFDNMLEQFTLHKAAVGELNHRSYSDFRKNFLFWIPKNLELKKLKNDTGKTRNHANLIDEETARRVFARVTEGDF